MSNSSRLLNWKGPETYPSSPIYTKDSWKLLPLHISNIWPSLVTQWVAVQKIYSEMHPASFTNTDHDVTDLLNHGMVKNTKI